MFQQVVWLVKNELKTQWIAMAFTVIVTIFMGLVSGNVLEQSVQNLFVAESPFYNHIVSDIIFIILTPSFAVVFMSRPYLSFQTIKEDPFSKRMALLRTLPIPIPILALSRIVFMMITFVVMSVTFYVVMTFTLTDSFFNHVTHSEYWIFILSWFGYALAIGGMNPVIEYGTNRKILHIFAWFLVLVYLLIIFLFYIFMEQGFVEWVLLLIKNHGWLVAVIPLLIGIGSSMFWNKLLIMRLAKKDYW